MAIGEDHEDVPGEGTLWQKERSHHGLGKPEVRRESAEGAPPFFLQKVPIIG